MFTQSDYDSETWAAQYPPMPPRRSFRCRLFGCRFWPTNYCARKHCNAHRHGWYQ